MRTLRNTAAVVFALGFGLSKVNAETTFNSFHVGNSLTGQTCWSLNNTIDGLASQTGEDLLWGAHIRGGSSLTTILQNPNEVSGDAGSFGLFGDALPNHVWNAVTLQPYSDTMPQGRTAISTFLGLLHQNPGNATTKTYLLSAWPQGASADSYSTRWNAPYDEATDNADARFTRQYALRLLDHARADNTASIIGMVPSAEVIYQIDQLARQGKFSSFDSAEDFYGDVYHLNASGAYVSRLTLYSTMFAQSPVGLPMPADAVFTAADLALVQETVWNVVSSNAGMTLVPEPSSAAMLAGIIGLLVRSRRTQ